MHSLAQHSRIAVSESTSTALLYRYWWIALGWGFVLLVVYLSLMRAPQTLDPKAFDAGHLLAYGWLMIWFAQLYRRSAARLVIATALFALGVALEFLQGTTDHRTFDYADMGMNALGVALGLLVARTPAQYALRWLERSIPR